MARIRLLLLVFVGLWFFVSCNTLEIGIERTPTPDFVAIGTLSNLMLRGTQLARAATERVSVNTPTPSKGFVNGRICYPGDHIPPMLLYFRELSTNQLTVLDIAEYQTEYSISLIPGNYYAFAWVISYQVGGMYSYAVPCGLSDNCADHSPLAVEIRAGETAAGIDVCDWVFPEELLPVPLGFLLPKP